MVARVLTFEEIATLRQWLSYNPNTGEITDWRGRRRDEPRGHYNIVIYLKQRYYAHRLAFVLMGLEIPPVVDHIDGDGHNNKWVNLRPSTPKLNARNQPKHRRGVPPGVVQHGDYFKVNDKTGLHIFETLEEAIAYVEPTYHLSTMEGEATTPVKPGTT